MQSCCFYFLSLIRLAKWCCNSSDIFKSYITLKDGFCPKQEMFLTIFLHQDYKQVHQAFRNIQAKENDLYMVTINKTESKDSETGAKI